jgi:hypothetical protein
MPSSPKQRATARRNVKKAAATAKRRRTASKLPRRTRTALAKQGTKVKRGRTQRRRGSKVA